MAISLYGVPYRVKHMVAVPPVVTPGANGMAGSTTSGQVCVAIEKP